jgi:hypothetical protein
MLGEQLFTGTVVDVARNKTETGGKVYSEEADLTEKWGKSLAHILSSLEPGTVTRLKDRIIPGLMGEQTTYGDALDPKKDIAAELTGIKTRTYNYESGVRFQAAKLGESIRTNNGDFLKTINRPGRVDHTEVLAAYDRMEERRQKRWREMQRFVAAAKRSGLSEETIYGQLTGGGLSDTEAAGLLSGVYEPYDITGEAVISATERRPDLPIDELARRYQAHAAKAGK